MLHRESQHFQCSAVLGVWLFSSYKISEINTLGISNGCNLHIDKTGIVQVQSSAPRNTCIKPNDPTRVNRMISNPTARWKKNIRGWKGRAWTSLRGQLWGLHRPPRPIMISGMQSAGDKQTGREWCPDTSAVHRGSTWLNHNVDKYRLILTLNMDYMKNNWSWCAGFDMVGLFYFIFKLCP